MEGAAQNFESSFPNKIEGENQLDLLDEINQLNQSYSSLIVSYQLLLLKHIKTTEGSVESLIETDLLLANYMQFSE
ncbi:DUF5344 family protein [Lentibacillus sp. Marseille-P4043]|uniref:DUF5344 family protein n=1 Tax=Lentibacillus sp. Marseille-P4043 TaxID=2040293 RepID=UPI000D0AD7E5|nr:DUF5344 family protein [Lentibacillus sp. Marseille-P4043]